MILMDTSYSLHLSPFEMRWLSSTLGLTRLPLPEDPLLRTSNSQLEAKLREAPTSLQARGLILRTKQDANWQVDRLPAAIVRWIGEAHSFLAVESQSVNSKSRRMNVYFAGEQAMRISLEGDSYNIVLYPNHELLINDLLTWVGSPSQTTKLPKESYLIPQPFIFIQTAWADQVTTAKIIRFAGINQKVGHDIQEWANTLQWVAKFWMVGPENPDTKIINELHMCENERWIWIGSGLRDSSEPIKMAPASEIDTRIAIKKFVPNPEENNSFLGNP
jgi:hypothetical protein